MLSAAGGSFLGLDAPDMTKVYWFFGAVAILFVAMAIIRGMARLREIRQERASAWRTFQKLAKARGLAAAEISVLAKATRREKIKRPSQVLAAIQVFDRVVNNFLEYEDTTPSQQAHLAMVRQKLVSTVEARGKDEDRRQLQRAQTSLPVQIQIIARDWVEEEMKGSLVEDDPKFQEAIETLLDGLVTVNAQMVDISAGGVCLVAQEETEVRDDDYVRLSGNVEILPIDINGMIGQITGTEAPKER